jgi:hypothetical protein
MQPPNWTSTEMAATMALALQAIAGSGRRFVKVVTVFGAL